MYRYGYGPPSQRRDHPSATTADPSSGASAHAANSTDPRPFPELAAALALAEAGIAVAPGYPPVEVAGQGMIGCACGRAACRAPGRHLHEGQSTAGGPTADRDQVKRWWGGGQSWSVATVTGAGLDVVQLSYEAPIGAVIGWLDDHGLLDIPAVIGHGHVEFLTGPCPGTPAYAPLPSGWVRRPPPGELVLFPPSCVPGGSPLTWYTALKADVDLVESAGLFAALAELPRPENLVAATSGPLGTDQPTSRRA